MQAAPDERHRLTAEREQAPLFRSLMVHYRGGAQAMTFLRNHLFTHQRA